MRNSIVSYLDKIEEAPSDNSIVIKGHVERNDSTANTYTTHVW